MWGTAFAFRKQACRTPEKLQLPQKHAGKAPNGQTEARYQLSGLTSAGVLSIAASLALSWSASFSANLSFVAAFTLSAAAELALRWQEPPAGQALAQPAKVFALAVVVSGKSVLAGIYFVHVSTKCDGLGPGVCLQQAGVPLSCKSEASADALLQLTGLCAPAGLSGCRGPSAHILCRLYTASNPFGFSRSLASFEGACSSFTTAVAGQ